MKNMILRLILLLSIFAFVSCNDDNESIVEDPVTSQNQNSVNQFTMLGTNRLIVHTEVIIKASAAKVWETISDFDGIGSWSPNLKRVVGDQIEGASVTAIYDFGESTLLENPVKLTWRENKRFGWAGVTLYGIDVYDNHQFMVVPVDENTTKFVHTDDLTSTAKEPNLEANIPQFRLFFEGFNRALKAHLEN